MTNTEYVYLSPYSGVLIRRKETTKVIPSKSTLAKEDILTQTVVQDEVLNPVRFEPVYAVPLLEGQPVPY